MYTYTNDGTAYWRVPTDLGYAAYALQLSKDTDPVIVYLSHGMLSDLKATQHRHRHPHLYVETVLKSEAEDNARVMAQGCHAHPQNAKCPTCDQPIQEKKSYWNIIGCPKELLSPDSTAGNTHRALHAEFLDSLQTPAHLSTRHETVPTRSPTPTAWGPKRSDQPNLDPDAAHDDDADEGLAKRKKKKKLAITGGKVPAHHRNGARLKPKTSRKALNSSLPSPIIIEHDMNDMSPFIQDQTHAFPLSLPQTQRETLSKIRFPKEKWLADVRLADLIDQDNTYGQASFHLARTAILQPLVDHGLFWSKTLSVLQGCKKLTKMGEETLHSVLDTAHEIRSTAAPICHYNDDDAVRQRVSLALSTSLLIVN
ncbi:unnamed protein product [Cercospora beticola]|nr:unnamed protein product [Cercospora beticola]